MTYHVNYDKIYMSHPPLWFLVVHSCTSLPPVMPHRTNKKLTKLAYPPKMGAPSIILIYSIHYKRHFWKFLCQKINELFPARFSQSQKCKRRGPTIWIVPLENALLMPLRISLPHRARIELFDMDIHCWKELCPARSGCLIYKCPVLYPPKI